MRAFVAIHLNEDTRRAIEKAQARLRESGASVRWVRPESLHLTLKFLGEIEMDAVPEVVKIIADATEGVGPFRLHFRGLGALPRTESPRVIYVDAADERGVLVPIANALNERMCSLGIEPEDRSFKVHVTIGRVKSPKRIQPLVEMIRAGADEEYGSVEVEEVCLMRSDLKPAGAEYTVLHAAKL